MAITKYKPTSPGRRGMSTQDFASITKSQPEKKLLEHKAEKAGRNNAGRITSRFRGGGHKQRYRKIDWKRQKTGVPAKVVGIEYDPNRSARIALIQYTDGEKAYILAPDGLKAGDTVSSGADSEARLGNCLPLARIPLGLTVHNVEMQPGRGGQICRSAGCSATLTNREGDWAQLTLPSGEIRRVPITCRASIGAMSNPDHMNVSLGKAGRKRWMGRKPHQRGVAQNPVSHPMGGGEGRTAGGRNPCSPTGKLAKGGKTRKKRKPSGGSIVRRRKPGPRYAGS